MTCPKPLSRTKTHVRCGSPNCDWGAPLSSLSDGHLDQFREHCIERHGLEPNETERFCWFDLEDGKHGYRKEYGDKKLYKEQYRKGFLRGYEDAFNRKSR